LINPASLIGGIAGFAVGIFLFRSPFMGFIFALIGSSIGSGIGARVYRDNRQQSGSTGWFAGWGYNAASDGPVFMETLFSMLGRLAAADGKVSPEEERVFRSVVVNELRIGDPASIQTAMDLFRKASTGSTPMGEYARRASATFRNRPQMLEMMLIIMIRVAAAEGGLHPEEDRLMKEVVSIFGFRPGSYETLKARYGLAGAAGSDGSRTGRSYAGGYSSSLSSSYEVLGVPGDAPESEVRKAYRKKVAEYHPDKIAAKGLPPEFTEFANRKFQDIQQAWEKIREAKGY
jgi:DnaJ like chaperone protein